MLTLITGVPGSGKSAALVQLLQQLASSRPLFVDNVPELKLPHQELDPHKWHEVVPDGGVLVIDEVQRIWPPRGPGSKVPDSVRELQTHRHRGVDIFIVSQSPALVDKAVRALVGRHVHLRDVGYLGRYWYEWPECSDQLAWKTAPIKRRYKLPKKVFALYKSSSLHVKPIRGFPVALVVAALALVGLVGGVWQSARVIFGDKGPAVVPAVVPAPGLAASAPALGTRAVTSGQTGAPVYRTAAEIVHAFTPRIAARPETAPAYDHLRLVVRMPRIQGGFCRGDECRCFLQGGLSAQIPVEDCRAWLANPPFDAYTVPQAPAVQQTAQQPPGAPPAGESS